MSAPIVDQTATGLVGSNQSLNLTLSTTQPNEVVIVAVVGIGNQGTPISAIEIADNASLFWYSRQESYNVGSGQLGIGYFFAIASAPLVADNISIVFTTGAATPVSVDGTAIAMSIIGANIVSPFDSFNNWPDIVLGAGSEVVSDPLYSNSSAPLLVSILFGGYGAGLGNFFTSNVTPPIGLSGYVTSDSEEEVAIAIAYEGFGTAISGAELFWESSNFGTPDLYLLSDALVPVATTFNINVSDSGHGSDSINTTLEKGTNDYGYGEDDIVSVIRLYPPPVDDGVNS